MKSSMPWGLALAMLASQTTYAADAGFYFGATGSRVEHDVEGSPGLLPIVVLTPPPGSIFPPPASGIIIRPPPGFNPIVSPVPIAILPTSVDIDDVDTGFSVTVGYRINRYLAAELSYADFGEYEITERYSFDNVSYKLGVSGPSVAVLGTLPLSERWELFLRGGVLFADQDVSLDFSTSIANIPDRNYSDEVVTAGAGVQWWFAPRWAARLEYQRTDDMKYDNTGESSIDQASLSVMFKL